MNSNVTVKYWADHKLLKEAEVPLEDMDLVDFLKGIDIIIGTWGNKIPVVVDGDTEHKYFMTGKFTDENGVINLYMEEIEE
jgi:hypothetical protein